jgi:Domain of unknown function (DUF4350)
MKQRWIALGLAAAALLSFYALVFPKPQSPQSQVSRPLSIETGADGLAGAWRWLEDSHIPVVSLRERYQQLPLLPLPARGNVLLTTLPAKLVVSPAEQLALERWIARGNTLLILAALDDTPGWTQGDEFNLPMLEEWTHIHFSSRHSSDEDGTIRESVTSLLRPTEIQLEPLGVHPLLQGIRQISVSSELPASHWLGAARDYATLAVARRRDDGDAALWLQARESGQILLCALAAPFSNAQITRADNARLLANIIAWSRTRDGRVLFDDGHQGLVSFYDPHAFYADPRLHRSLGWMLALWLLWVLGSQPLRVQQQPWMPIDETQLIDAGGRFFSRHVPAAGAAHALLENFFNELRRRLHQSEDGTPPWEWLAMQPRITPENLQALQRDWRRASAGEKIDLASLQNLLVELRENLE